jgi:hypothetical protein
MEGLFRHRDPQALILNSFTLRTPLPQRALIQRMVKTALLPLHLT